MKIEISYKNSVIGSLLAGESIALHLNGQKLTDDLVVRAVAEVKKLSAPIITTDGSVVTITDTSGLATEFGFYHNGIPLFYTADIVVNLSEKLLDTYGAGTYNITVTALADGYEESEPSNAVEYVVKESVQTLIKVYSSGTNNLVATFDITEYVGQTFASVVNKTTIGSDSITYKLVNTINADYMYVVDANDYFLIGSVGYRTTNTIPADENIGVHLSYN